MSYFGNFADLLELHVLRRHTEQEQYRLNGCIFLECWNIILKKEIEKNPHFMEQVFI